MLTDDGGPRAFEEDGTPEVFDTEDAAFTELATEMISQYEEVLNGDRHPEEVQLIEVVEAEQDSDGTITTETGETWEPLL